MKIDGTKPISDVEKAPVVERAASPTHADRVSVEEARKAAEVVQVAHARVGGARAGKLSQIEAAVRRGDYRPSPGAIAEQILNAAEIDAKLQAMLNH